MPGAEVDWCLFQSRVKTPGNQFDGRALCPGAIFAITPHFDPALTFSPANDLAVLLQEQHPFNLIIVMYVSLCFGAIDVKAPYDPSMILEYGHRTVTGFTENAAVDLSASLN